MKLSFPLEFLISSKIKRLLGIKSVCMSIVLEPQFVDFCLCNCNPVRRCIVVLTQAVFDMCTCFWAVSSLWWYCLTITDEFVQARILQPTLGRAEPTRTYTRNGQTVFVLLLILIVKNHVKSSHVVWLILFFIKFKL